MWRARGWPAPGRPPPPAPRPPPAPPAPPADVAAPRVPRPGSAALPRARPVRPPRARRVPRDHMIRVAIIGAGRGGTSLIHILHNDPLVTIVGVADIDPHAPGMLLARQLKIPI